MKKRMILKFLIMISLGHLQPLFAGDSFAYEVVNIINSNSTLKKLAEESIQAIPLESHQKFHELDELLICDPHLIKLSIRSNVLKVSKYEASLSFRAEKVITSFNWLLEKFPIDDCDLYISLGDATPLNQQICFAMCKQYEKSNVILMPDYDQLAANYEVLNNKKITNYKIPFKSKINKAFWRGCTAGSIFSCENYTSNCRVKLCQISLTHPSLLDAGFTYYAQGAENIPEMQIYKKGWVKYEDEMKYKYLIWIDGNVSSYSASGWRLFSNSCVLKQNSPFLQWYYPLLIPYKHFVPFEHDCSNLIEQLEWCFNHQNECSQIAENSRNFAKTHITKAHAFAFLYFILKEYSQLYKKIAN